MNQWRNIIYSLNDDYFVLSRIFYDLYSSLPADIEVHTW